MQPRLSGAAIGVGEDQDFELRGHLFERRAQVVDFFTAVFRLACDDDLGFYAGRSGHAFDGAISGVRFGSKYKKDFVILMLEFTKGNKVAFESWFHSAARAQDGSARGIEARI